MLRQICREKTTLSDEEILQLEDLSRQLPLMAELVQADLFLDCPVDETTAVVVAQSGCGSSFSLYKTSVVGQLAPIEKEPAVLHALRVHAPVRDIKAVTQEDRTVIQNVCPVHNRAGQVIAVLIQERDISERVGQEKKLEALSKSHESEAPSLRSEQVDRETAAAMRETHHRIKNSLQMVASILNLQARKHKGTEAGEILGENVGRVLSIATIHDILTQLHDRTEGIGSLALLEKLAAGLRAFVPGEKQIQIVVQGDDTPLSGSQASAVALVVNELMTNALKHAFPAHDSGTVTVSFRAGQRFHTVTVSDNGTGFPGSTSEEGGLGLRIAETTVRGKLKGAFHIHSDPNGTQISFDLKNETL